MSTTKNIDEHETPEPKEKETNLKGDGETTSMSAISMTTEWIAKSSPEESASMPELAPYDIGARSKWVPKILPEDSASMTGRSSNVSCSSMRTTASALAYKNKQREIELVARSAALAQKSKLDQRKRLLQKELSLQEAENEIKHAQERAMYLKRRQEIEEEEAKIDQEQQEIEISAELQATRAISKMMDEQESRGISTTVSKKITEDMLKAIHHDVIKLETASTIPVPVSQSTLKPDAKVFSSVANEVSMTTIDCNPPVKSQDVKNDIEPKVPATPSHSNSDQVSMAIILSKIVENQ